MKLREYFTAREQWLRSMRHPKTVAETRVAVDAFCDWFGGDIDIDNVTATMVNEFEAAEESTRRRQLTSNLLALLRLYDPKSFPRRSKSLLANAKYESFEAAPKAVTDKPETLSEFARLYISRRAICENYAHSLRKRSEKFEAWLGKTAIEEVLTEATLNAFLAAIVGTGSAYTIRKYRQDLLTLWSAAADDDLVPYPNRRRIRKEPVHAVVIECYEPSEVLALVRTAERLKGAFDNGVVRRFYWSALLRFAWDSGLRRGDCWRFDRSIVQPDGTFRMVQSKTRKPIRRKLRPQTLEAIDKIDSPKPLAWPLCEWSFGFHFQRLVATSGVDRGSFRWLRRGCGSHVEAVTPGGGCKVLGNTPQVFRQSYDADLAADVLMPPSLDD